MARRELAPGTALVLPGTRQIHSHFMWVPIKVVFYTADGAVLHRIHSLVPWRVSARVPGAAGVIELPAGTLAACGILLGARLHMG